MNPLPAQQLAAVPHVVFGIFNLAIPNILAWAVIVVVFIAAVWLRMPRVFEPVAGKEEVLREPH